MKYFQRFYLVFHQIELWRPRTQFAPHWALFRVGDNWADPPSHCLWASFRFTEMLAHFRNILDPMCVANCYDWFVVFYMAAKVKRSQGVCVILHFVCRANGVPPCSATCVTSHFPSFRFFHAELSATTADWTLAIVASIPYEWVASSHINLCPNFGLIVE